MDLSATLRIKRFREMEYISPFSPHPEISFVHLWPNAVGILSDAPRTFSAVHPARVRTSLAVDFISPHIADLAYQNGGQFLGIGSFDFSGQKI
jgi:hypothetical protein